MLLLLILPICTQEKLYHPHEYIYDVCFDFSSICLCGFHMKTTSELCNCVQTRSGSRERPPKLQSYQIKMSLFNRRQLSVILVVHNSPRERREESEREESERKERGRQRRMKERKRDREEERERGE